MNADEFYDSLTEIVKPGTDAALMWSSESDYPIEVVRLPDIEVFGWVPETTIYANRKRFVLPTDLLIYQIDLERQYEEIKQLINEFSGWVITSRVFRRVMEDDKPAEITLFLLVRFCEIWVGLRCKIIET